MNENLADKIETEINNLAADSKKVTMLVYILQGLSFIFGITFFIAVIINYLKKDEVRGNWLESHFRWQIRTFWFSLLWSIIGIASLILLIGYIILLIDALWLIYRIVKGLLQLNENKPMYQ